MRGTTILFKTLILYALNELLFWFLQTLDVSLKVPPLPALKRYKNVSTTFQNQSVAFSKRISAFIHAASFRPSPISSRFSFAN